jgi:hypothetical protein
VKPAETDWYKPTSKHAMMSLKKEPLLPASRQTAFARQPPINVERVDVFSTGPPEAVRRRVFRRDV